MDVTYLRFDAAPLAVDTADADGTDREVSGLVVPFGVVANRGMFKAQFTKEGTKLPDDLSTVKLLLEHDPEHPVGYATAAEYTDAGLNMTFSVPTDHTRAAGYLADLDANLRDGFSVGIELDDDAQAAIGAVMWGETDPAEPVDMTGTVREVSGVAVPQFNDARADRNTNRRLIRFSAQPGEVTMPAPTEAPPAEPVQLPTTEELAAQVGEILASAMTAPAHPLARFATLDQYAAAVWDGSLAPAERFALVDQVTTDNPGVIPPAWLTTIVGVIDRGRPAISAFGGPGALPPAGMDVTWPFYDGDFTALVAAQATEKSDIHSVKVSLKKASVTLASYAGGSDISYQLIRRSDPAYLAAYQQIMAIGYSATTDAKFCADLVAGGTAQPVTVVDASSIRGALFSASLAVQTATGVPATAVVVASDVFASWGALPDLFPTMYGTQNIGGTADASTLRINVSGLEVTCDPYLAAGHVVVSNELAAKWLEDGPFPVTADDVSKLGQNTAIWGMGVTRIAVPTGVIVMTAAVAPPPLADEGTSTRKK